jgi:DNA-binding response OmpR family regulator
MHRANAVRTFSTSEVPMPVLTPPRAAPAVDLGANTLHALVVDDDPGVVGFLDDNLTADRFSVITARSAEDALGIVMTSRPDIALIDVALPGMSGFDLVSALREGDPAGSWDPGMAIILMSGRDDVHSVVRGIERGADDYLVKPFHYPELLARVGSHVRRARGVSIAGSLRVGPVEVDRRAMRVLVHGRTLGLSAKEFGLLSVLARDPHRVVSKGELLRDVWGFSANARTRTVDTHASRLRGKLATAGVFGWVRNVWGQGYRLLPEER